MPDTPGFWRNETSGVLKPAVETYLQDMPMTDRDIASMRLYFRQWIDAPEFRGEMVDALRVQVDSITTRDDIDRWLDRAIDAGIDPL